jgi:hypothetical protein
MVLCRCKNMQELLDFTAQHFNAIRMPFSAELALNMEQRQPGNIDYAANPDLQGLNTGQVMDRWDMPLQSNSWGSLLLCCG